MGVQGRASSMDMRDGGCFGLLDRDPPDAVLEAEELRIMSSDEAEQLSSSELAPETMASPADSWISWNFFASLDISFMVELRGRISIPGACGELEHRRISSGQSARLNSSCGFFLWPDDSHTAELVADALMHIDFERARDKGRPSDSPELLLLLRRAVADMLWLRGLG